MVSAGVLVGMRVSSIKLPGGGPTAHMNLVPPASMAPSKGSVIRNYIDTAVLNDYNSFDFAALVIDKFL